MATDSLMTVNTAKVETAEYRSKDEVIQASNNIRDSDITQGQRMPLLSNIH